MKSVSARPELFGMMKFMIFKYGFLALLLVLSLSACSSGSGQKRSPFLGNYLPPEAMAPAGVAKPQTVLVRGDVKNPVIPWTEDLTVARAIVAADYKGLFDPRVILLVRQGLASRIDPKQLLRGRGDLPVEPGDVIELQR